jgi:hypothetical protein
LTFELTVDDGHGNTDTSVTHVTVFPIHKPPTTNITYAVDGDGNPIANNADIAIRTSQDVHRASSITLAASTVSNCLIS